jgi:hypothetical protein
MIFLGDSNQPPQPTRDLPGGQDALEWKTDTFNVRQGTEEKLIRVERVPDAPSYCQSGSDPKAW